jgi:hypothetical protein
VSAPLNRRHPAPWSVGYGNDVGPNDEGFWEWWAVKDAKGREVARCDDEEDAEALTQVPSLVEALGALVCEVETIPEVMSRIAPHVHVSTENPTLDRARTLLASIRGTP